MSGVPASEICWACKNAEDGIQSALECMAAGGGDRPTLEHAMRVCEETRDRHRKLDGCTWVAPPQTQRTVPMSVGDDDDGSCPECRGTAGGIRLALDMMAAGRGARESLERAVRNMEKQRDEHRRNDGCTWPLPPPDERLAGVFSSLSLQPEQRQIDPHYGDFSRFGTTVIHRPHMVYLAPPDITTAAGRAISLMIPDAHARVLNEYGTELVRELEEEGRKPGDDAAGPA
jgi:hypothetical protein